MIFVLRFPTTINHSEYYQYLDFDKNDLHRELERLVAMELNLDRSLQSNYNDLKNNVWKPRLEKLIEKCAMEKIYWAAALKKVAGSVFWNLLLCKLHRANTVVILFDYIHFRFEQAKACDKG